jgi:hypothetical protein
MKLPVIIVLVLLLTPISISTERAADDVMFDIHQVDKFYQSNKAKMLTTEYNIGDGSLVNKKFLKELAQFDADCRQQIKIDRMVSHQRMMDFIDEGLRRIAKKFDLKSEEEQVGEAKKKSKNKNADNSLVLTHNGIDSEQLKTNDWQFMKRRKSEEKLSVQDGQNVDNILKKNDEKYHDDEDDLNYQLFQQKQEEKNGNQKSSESIMDKKKELLYETVFDRSSDKKFARIKDARYLNKQPKFVDETNFDNIF